MPKSEERIENVWVENKTSKKMHCILFEHNPTLITDTLDKIVGQNQDVSANILGDLVLRNTSTLNL